MVSANVSCCQGHGDIDESDTSIADVRIHKVCVHVCVHRYVHLHVFTSAYASIPPSHEEQMPFFESLALGMT